MFKGSIFDRQNNGKVLIILLGISVMLMLTAASNSIILNLFPDRVIADDLLFRVFEMPTTHLLEYYTDLMILVMLAIAIWSWKDDFKHYFPYLAANATVFYSLRAIINILTPLQRPLGADVSHGLLRNVAIQYGMFPSGHVGFTILLFLLCKDRIGATSRNVLVALIAMQAIFMVVSRGHYSIDLVGGALLAYFVFKVLEPYKEKLVFEDNQAS